MRSTFLILLVSLGTNAFGFDPVMMAPDPNLTPGKLAASPREQLGVTSEMERQVFARYAIPWTRRAEFRIDHLIPKQLGGSDDISNLWPQSLTAKPYNPRRKDLLTRRLVQLVAAKRMTLAEAQRAIREDWISAYVQYVGMVYLTPGIVPKSRAR